jgi:predicted histidine transporter YuiF (NhaC family)
VEAVDDVGRLITVGVGEGAGVVPRVASMYAPAMNRASAMVMARSAKRSTPTYRRAQASG